MGLFSSNKASTTVQSTTNHQYDQRQVYDAGGGVIGEGNYMDTSSTFDMSNRSTTSINNDTSNRSTTNITTVDAGAMAAATAAQQSAASVVSGAVKDSFAFATSNSQTAYNTSRDAMGLLETGFSGLMDLVKDVTTQAGDQAKAAANVANAAYSSAASTAQGAYQSAADTSNGNKTLIYVAMAAVALVAAGIYFKR